MQRKFQPTVDERTSAFVCRPGVLNPQINQRNQIFLLRSIAVAALVSFATMSDAATGDFDTSFGTGGVARISGDAALPTESFATSLGLDASGRLLVAGIATQTRTGVFARLQPSGARDSGLGGSGYVLRPAAGSTYTREPVQVFSLENGNVILTESTLRPCFGSPGGCAVNNIFIPLLEATRLRADGSVDSTYGTKSGMTGLGFLPTSVTADKDGALSVMGVQNLFPAPNLGLARIDMNGLVSATPNFATLSTAIHCGDAYSALPTKLVTVRHTNNRLLVAQLLKREATQQNEFCITRLNQDGTRDTSFGNSGQTVISDARLASHFPFKIMVRSDNAINILLLDGPPKVLHQPALIRLTANGLPDAGQGNQGILFPLPAAVSSIAAATLQADDKLLFAGFGSKFVSGAFVIDESRPLVGRQASSAGVVDFSFGSLRGGFTNLVIGGERIDPADIVAAADGSIFVAGGIGTLSPAGPTLMAVAKLLGDTPAPASNPANNDSGGGGCGITRNSDAPIDPTLLMMALIAAAMLLGNRRNR